MSRSFPAGGTKARCANVERSSGTRLYDRAEMVDDSAIPPIEKAQEDFARPSIFHAAKGSGKITESLRIGSGHDVIRRNPLTAISRASLYPRIDLPFWVVSNASEYSDCSTQENRHVQNGYR